MPKQDMQKMKSRKNKASQALSAKDARLESERNQISASSVSEIRLDQIYTRDTNTRDLNAIHVVNLALAIEAVGLIEPLVVDREYYIIAGNHRLSALKLLHESSRNDTIEDLKKSLSSKKLQEFEGLLPQLPESSRIDFEKLPVRVFDFLASKDPEKALAIEAIENTNRRDYTSKEIRKICEKLKQAGYVQIKGRPKEGQKSLKVAVSVILGKSLKTAQRILKEGENDLNSSKRYISQADAIYKSAFRLQKKVLNASKKTEKGLRENEDFLACISALNSWAQNQPDK